MSKTLPPPPETRSPRDPTGDVAQDVAQARGRLEVPVQGLRRRLVRLTAGEGLLWVLASFAAAAAVALGLDWWWGLPRGARLLTDLVVIAVAGYAAWRVGWVRWRRLPRREGLALWVERRRPELRSRLISALQLSRQSVGSPEGRAYVRRLVEDAGRAAADLDPGALAPADSLRRCAWRTVPILALGVALLGVTWPVSQVLLRRALLEEVPVPRKTRLVEITGARIVGRGDDLEISARVEGVMPGEGMLIVRHASGRVQRLSLEAEEGRRGVYRRRLANLSSPFQYRVRIHDAESGEFPVTVLPRPVVTNLVLVQTPPAYAGLASREVAPGELTLLRGSRLRVEGAASQALRRATIRLGGLDEAVVASIEGGGRDRFSADLAIEDARLTGFSVDLEDDHGIGSRDPAVYTIQVVPDRPPKVRMILPARREELATVRGKVLVAFEVSDDLGLASLWLRHQPAGSTNRSGLGGREFELAGETQGTLRRRFEWDMASVQPRPAEGELLEFWIEAMDRNDRDGPGVGRGEPFVVRLVSEAEKRADLLTRAGDAIGRLGDVAQGQERLNETLGRIILAKPPER